MNNKLYKLMNWPRIEAVIYSEEDAPHEILGPHMVGLNVLFQTFMPDAFAVNIIYEKHEKKFPMELVDEAGFFACLFTGKIPEDYEYEVTDQKGNITYVKDAYRYFMDLSPKDIDKFNAGIHYTVYEKLGAHPVENEGVQGIYFAVWAPNAARVSVVGEFNHWDGRIHQMNRNTDSGIYSLFIPDVQKNACYKYEIKTKSGITFLKTDPYAVESQLSPDTASVIKELSYQWHDEEWIQNRTNQQAEEAPINIYELYLDSISNNKKTKEYMNYRELTPIIIKNVKELGYTHVELMPIMEHSNDDSLGYQVIGYYAPTARYGTADDFMFMIDELHQAGIGVILDWVPACFQPNAEGLAGFDGTCLYEHQDPRKGTNPKWGTLLYNYGRPQVSNFLIANALFWVEKFHADGLRMHAVASMLYLDYDKNEGEWVANIYGGNENLEAIEMLKHLNSIMKKRNPGVLMIAEESSAFPNTTGKLDEGGLGFDLKWNDGFTNDLIDYLSYDPYFRAHHHSELTLSMIYAYRENYVLPFAYLFMNNGQVDLLEKMPGTEEEQLANLRMAYAYMMTHPGKKLNYLDQNSSHKEINKLIKELNALYTNKPALYQLDSTPNGFEWINNISSEKCMISFMRKTDKIEETLVVVANFANIEQTFQIGVPYEGKYKELLNTDDKRFGGEGRTNSRAKSTTNDTVDDRAYSFKMNAAPLSLCIFSYEPFSKKDELQIHKRKEQQEAKKRVQEAMQKAEAAKKEAEAARLQVEKAEELLKIAMRKVVEAEKTVLEEKAKAGLSDSGAD